MTAHALTTINIDVEVSTSSLSWVAIGPRKPHTGQFKNLLKVFATRPSVKYEEIQGCSGAIHMKKPDAWKQRRRGKENMMTGGICGRIDCDNGYDDVCIIGYVLQEGRRLLGKILDLVHEMRTCYLVTKRLHCTYVAKLSFVT